MEKEIWKDIPQHEGCYQVSNLGRVRSVDRTITYSDGRVRDYEGSGMLKHRSGVKGVFVKSFYPTGKPLTTVIETDKGYYCAPSDEFVDA